jgi:hypothetical protein
VNKGKPLRKVADVRKQCLVTVRLDEPTLYRMGRKVPSEYKTVSALIRAGIDEILNDKNSGIER